jgi:hypothetical protein
MKKPLFIRALIVLMITTFTLVSCSSNESGKVISQIPNGEFVTIKSVTPERDFSLFVVADRDDYGQKDMEFYVSAESPADLHDLIKANVGKKVRIAWADGLISAAEELEGNPPRFAGSSSQEANKEVSDGGEPQMAQGSVEESPTLDFPFRAVIQCQVSGVTQSVATCLAGDGAKTQIELRNGDEYAVFSNVDVIRRRLGEENQQREIEVQLRSSFELKAQNSDSRRLLTVRIVDQATGEQVFEQSAAQYEVISISN